MIKTYEAKNNQHSGYRSYYKDGFCISTEKARLDLCAIHRFLSTEAYWSLNIPFSRVEAAVAHSLNFGLYQGDEQIGFARIVTDYASIAYLGDVYVLREFRGRGLAKWLMQTIIEYPELQGLRRWILSTKDAHGLYNQFGWTPILYPERWMEIHDREVYSRRL
jgi:GNAT superfamily N-acetyltransferase